VAPCEDYCAAHTPHDGPCYSIEPGRGVHNGAPAGPVTMAMPTTGQRTTMHRAALKLGTTTKPVVRVLDDAHALGLAIPPKAAEALDVLAALAVAWQANSAGHPAPPSVKRTLGLV
jgi:hypothetical protein